MTDKQIIIDGVDVSGCENFSGTYAKECKAVYANSGYKELHDLKCNKSPNCYYKQLKRKEQECEEFRKANDEKNELLAKLGCPTIATAKRKVFCLQEQIDKLKVENDELKRELIQYEKDVKDLNYFAIKLKQTLTEIKEVATHCMKQDICTTCDNSEKCHIEDEEIPSYDVCKLILQKISEAEE